MVHSGTKGAGAIPIARTKEVRPLLHNLLPEADQFPRTQSVPRFALRFYILLPTAAAAFVTFVAVGVPLAFNTVAQLSEKKA